MAAEDEGRTEEPSEHRLEQARKEGRVAKSQEISSALILLLTITVLLFMGRWMMSQCVYILQYFFTRTNNPDVRDANLFSAFLINFLKMLAPVAGVAVFAGITANIIQNKGFIFSTKPIEPNFNKIVPKFGEYFRKTIFSGKGLFNIAKSILKVTIIVIIGYLTIRKNIFVIIEIVSNGQLYQAVGKIASTAAQIVIIVGVLFLALSIPDFFVQRKEFRESMKMTKQEVKQEYKELEGDPEVKGHLESAQREMLSRNMPKAVREADVVITNPTHFAVALQWKREKYDSPQVTAKGEDLTAQNMKRIARENDVPIVENKPLARGLYNDVEIGQEIPDSYIKAISTVYVQIHYLDKQAKS